MTSAEYVHTGCTSRCSPDETINYHVYTQWLGSTPSKQAQSLLAIFNPDQKAHTDTSAGAAEEEAQWEYLPTIDSYIPQLKLAVPVTPSFREWRTKLLSKGAEVQQILELMELVETRLAEELQHQHIEHHICQQLDDDWEKYRRYPSEERPEKCRNRENITKLWRKLTQLSDFLKVAEGEYLALQTPPAGGIDFSGLITTLSPLPQNRRQNRHANYQQWSVDDLKDTVHQLAVFRF